MSAALLGAAMKAKLGSRTRKLVLIKLVDCCHEDGTNIYPALATVAEDAECSVSTARRTLREFCAVGLLRKVKDGGTGPRSTAHYEMDVDLLALLRRADTWPALEAASLHEPLSDSDDDDAPAHAPRASNGGGEPVPCENKGVTVEGLHGATLPNQTVRVPSGDTQPLSRTLSSEREGARAREASPTIEGGAETASEPQGTATFAEFLEAYPHAKGDNRVQLRAAWEALPFDLRRAAIDGIGAFAAERKAGGLKSRLSAPQYLAGQHWIGLEAKAGERKAQAATGSVVTVDGWSRDWWLLLFDRVFAGKNPGLWMQFAEARKTMSTTSGDLGAAAKRVGELKPYLCTGPEIDAWRPWLAARGARIPPFSGEFRVFLPSETPPAGRREQGDDDVRL